MVDVVHGWSRVARPYTAPRPDSGSGSVCDPRRHNGDLVAMSPGIPLASGGSVHRFPSSSPGCDAKGCSGIESREDLRPAYDLPEHPISSRAKARP